MYTYKLENGIRIPYVQIYEATKRRSFTEDIFVEYLDVLFRRKTSRSVCSQKMSSSNEYFVQLDIPNLTVKMSHGLRERFKKCIQDEDKWYFIVPFHIRFPTFYSASSVGEDDELNLGSPSVGHSNTVLIDKSTQQIELFEPHGDRFRGHPIEINTKLLIHETVKKLFPFTQTYTFRSAFDTCNVAPQREDKYCLAWTLLYIELRLLNGNTKVSTETLFRQFNSIFISDAQRVVYIQKYITMVTERVKDIRKVYNAYPDYMLPFPILDPFIPDNIAFTVRFLALLYKYKTVSNEVERKQILNEVVGYRRHSRFEKIFFDFFNNKYDDILEIFKENNFIFEQFDDANEFARMVKALYTIKQSQNRQIGN
ncbi:hypothetical protein EB118_02150 [bacterium]|nr:hypothetical protein [bacterium]NDC93913.1 hypothetical protein [bacterium]NDD83254.1 hypothetical protein [bacterium]NDG28890.1 hypothetical protein [bacterium]